MEEIREAKETRRGTRLQVKWTGYARPTWEPLSALEARSGTWKPRISM